MSSAPASQPAHLSHQLDKQLAATAYKKVMAGQEPTAQERAALARYERQQEEDRRWQYYGSIPQKHWRQMSGRQTKVLHEQAERYGLPFGGATINLPDVVRALHNFLAENARRLATDDDDLLQGGGNSPALERYREERALLARLDRLEREGELVARENVRQGLGQIAGLLRTAGESLQRECGTEARLILDEALDDAEREIGRLFGGDEACDGGETPCEDMSTGETPCDEPASDDGACAGEAPSADLTCDDPPAAPSDDDEEVAG